MLKHIKSTDPEEFDTEERCSVLELLNSADSPELSIARCRVKPGITTQLHALDQTNETYLIEQGKGMMDDGSSDPFPVGPGDSIEIAANHPQRIRNTGNLDLLFLVVCRPRFDPGCYINLES